MIASALDLGPHAAFIWWSYVLVAAVIGGLVAWLVADGRRMLRQLDALDARGIRRRSVDPD
jgi:heme exporter protein D